MKIFFVLLFALAAHAFEVPTFTPNVVDQTGKLSPAEIARINSAIGDVQKQGTLVGVLMTPTLGGEAIEDVASKVFSTWKLGQKGKDNGVLIVVAVDDHKMRIEVGYGLEGRITDAQSQDVIRHVMRPHFKSGDFGGGIEQAVKDLGSMAKGEFPAYQKNDGGETLDPWLERAKLWTLLFLGIPALILGLAVIFASVMDNKGFNIRKKNGQKFYLYFFGMVDSGQVALKLFLYLNPGIFITRFPIVFGDEPMMPMIMNGLGVIFVVVSSWVALKAALDLFSEEKALEYLENKDKKKSRRSGWSRSSSSSYGYDYGSSSSSSSDSSWSSSDSSSSSSDGGSSGGGGSSGDW